MKPYFSTQIYDLVFYFKYCLLYVVIQSCTSKENIQELSDTPLLFRVEGSQLLKENRPVFYKGVNALQTYGLGDAELMDRWNIEIVREFIGNLREQPISGGAIQASDAIWYHPLQSIVDQNRAHGKITILCPFGWVNQDGERTLLTGLNPLEQDFYPAYKTKMQAIAQHFSDQPDVWIEVWNEPFHWNNQNNYSIDYNEAYPFQITDGDIIPTDRTEYIYCLISKRYHDEIYIGQTQCLSQRLINHNSGHGSYSTNSIQKRPWAVAAYICGLSHLGHQ